MTHPEQGEDLSGWARTMVKQFFFLSLSQVAFTKFNSTQLRWRCILKLKCIWIYIYKHFEQGLGSTFSTDYQRQANSSAKSLKSFFLIHKLKTCFLFKVLNKSHYPALISLLLIYIYIYIFQSFKHKIPANSRNGPMSTYKKQFSKKPLWNDIFRHFITSNLSQKHRLISEKHQR